MDILYRDDYLLVVNKPANLLSVPGKTEKDCLIDRLLKDFPNARMVHRLDRATSGIILVPLDYETHKHLSKQFELRQVDKTYEAIVNGKLTQDCGAVTLPLICDWPNRPKQKVCHESGKAAHTDYQVMEYFAKNNSTRISLHPITGRSHQLRVHMLALGHPILGDVFYADEEALNKAERLLLHAKEISFTHPHSDEKLHFTCAPSF